MIKNFYNVNKYAYGFSSVYLFVKFHELFFKIMRFSSFHLIEAGGIQGKTRYTQAAEIITVGLLFDHQRDTVWSWSKNRNNLGLTFLYIYTLLRIFKLKLEVFQLITPYPYR